MGMKPKCLWIHKQSEKNSLSQKYSQDVEPAAVEMT